MSLISYGLKSKFRLDYLFDNYLLEMVNLSILFRISKNLWSLAWDPN